MAGFGKKIETLETPGDDITQFINIKSIVKKDLMLIGVNPRTELNTEVINTLKTIEDIDSIKIGYCSPTSPIEFDGKRLAGKYFLVDGEHRYRSRNDEDKLPCSVKHYENVLDILKDSVVFNLHGQRLKNEEIFNVIDKEINLHFLENGMDYTKLPNMKGLARTYRVDKDTSFSLTYLHILKKKVPNIDEYDCLKQKSLKKDEEVFRRYIILGMKELIKTDKTTITTFLQEFTPYIKTVTYGRTKDLQDVISGYLAGEYKTYQEFIEKRQLENEANTDILGFLQGQGVKSLEDENEDSTVGSKKTSNLDLGLHVKKVSTVIKQSIQTISVLKGTNKDKLNLRFPEDADLDEIKDKAEQLIELINELKK